MSCFSAQSMLEKHGWTTGSGLGKEESGIKQAIKVELKNDKKGVGHDPGEQYTFHWWDHAFNKAANNINVEVNDDGVKVTQSGDFDISAKKQQAKTLASKDMLYGRFIKAATLNGNDMVSETPEGSGDSDDSDEYDKASSAKFTDAQLFEKCGGLTAHKGARHGLNLSGKLQRIMEQEARLTPNGSPGSSPKQQSDSEEIIVTKNPKKSKKKCKKDKSHSAVNDTSSKESSDSGIVNNVERKRKKKSKREPVSEILENNNPKESLEMESDLNNLKSTKKKKSSKTDVNETDIDEQVGATIAVEDCVQKKKKKSKKNKHCDTDVPSGADMATDMKTCRDIVSDEPDIQQKTKKAKKHKKNKESTADNQESAKELLSRKRKLDDVTDSQDASLGISKKSRKKKKSK